MVDDPKTPEQPTEDKPVDTSWGVKGASGPEEAPVEDVSVPLHWLEEGEEK